jgi:HPt (histidine-containing phosphotransfer) domain-containing protein
MDYDQNFEILRQKFLDRCRADLQVLNRAVESPSERMGKDLEHVVHRMAGISGTLGFHDLSETCLEIDDMFAKHSSPSERDLLKLLGQLSKLGVT